MEDDDSDRVVAGDGVVARPRRLPAIRGPPPGLHSPELAEKRMLPTSAEESASVDKHLHLGPDRGAGRAIHASHARQTEAAALPAAPLQSTSSPARRDLFDELVQAGTGAGSNQTAGNRFSIGGSGRARRNGSRTVAPGASGYVVDGVTGRVHPPARSHGTGADGLLSTSPPPSSSAQRISGKVSASFGTIVQAAKAKAEMHAESRSRREEVEALFQPSQLMQRAYRLVIMGRAADAAERRIRFTSTLPQVTGIVVVHHSRLATHSTIVS